MVSLHRETRVYKDTQTHSPTEKYIHAHTYMQKERTGSAFCCYDGGVHSVLVTGSSMTLNVCYPISALSFSFYAIILCNIRLNIFRFLHYLSEPTAVQVRNSVESPMYSANSLVLESQQSKVLKRSRRGLSPLLHKCWNAYPYVKQCILLISTEEKSPLRTCGLKQNSISESLCVLSAVHLVYVI